MPAANTATHGISHAKVLRHGDAWYSLAGTRRGIPMTTPIVKQDFGVIQTADADALVTKQVVATAAVTGYTFASLVAGVTGTTARTLATPRNVTITASDMDGQPVFLIKGTDVYGATMWERILVTASDATVSGVKAFKTINSIEQTVAGVSGTFYIGMGNRFGLNYKVESVHDVIKLQEGNAQALPTAYGVTALLLPTYTATEVASATADGQASANRDVRGTYKPLTAPNASLRFSAWYKVSDPSSKFGAYGLDQAAS